MRNRERLFYSFRNYDLLRSKLLERFAVLLYCCYGNRNGRYNTIKQMQHCCICCIVSSISITVILPIISFHTQNGSNFTNFGYASFRHLFIIMWKMTHSMLSAQTGKLWRKQWRKLMIDDVIVIGDWVQMFLTWRKKRVNRKFLNDLFLFLVFFVNFDNDA